MRKIFLLSSIASTLWFTSCQRQSIVGFQKSTTPAYERKVVAHQASVQAAELEKPVVTEAQVADVAVSAPVVSETAVAPVTTTEQTASPEMLASVSEKLVAKAKGTQYEKKALAIEKKLAKIQESAKSGQIQTTKKASFADKVMSKTIAKKIQQQIAKAKEIKKTNAVNGSIKMGLIVLIIGLLLLLLAGGNPTVNVIGVILLVAGAVVLLIGLIDSL